MGRFVNISNCHPERRPSCRAFAGCSEGSPEVLRFFPFTSFRVRMTVFLFFLSGCASVQMPGYIARADHPYDRKFYASFEKVVSTVMYVLKTKGWSISNEADPSIYERDDRYDNSNYQNLLIMTNVKRKSLYLTSTHLNIFIHSIANTCDVEIRYEAKTPLVKQFISTHNDQLAQGILDAVEDEISR